MIFFLLLRDSPVRGNPSLVRSFGCSVNGGAEKNDHIYGDQDHVGRESFHLPSPLPSLHNEKSWIGQVKGRRRRRRSYCLQEREKKGKGARRKGYRKEMEKERSILVRIPYRSLKVITIDHGFNREGKKIRRKKKKKLLALLLMYAAIREEEGYFS